MVKSNSRSSLKGAGAVIACFLGGQIALGAPAAKTRSNGEVLFCENLAMADAAARKALNGTTILKQVTTELTERVQTKLIEAGLLRDGGTVAAITERELRANTRAQLCALAATLAARGFACMAGGQLILFLAANDSMVEGEVIKMPRSLGNSVHGLESQQPARWARFRRFTPGQKVPTTSELVEAVKKERAKNAAKGGEANAGLLKPRLSAGELKDQRRRPSQTRGEFTCMWNCKARASTLNDMCKHYRRVTEALKEGKKTPCKCTGPLPSPALCAMGGAVDTAGTAAAAGSSADASALKRKRQPPARLADYENGDEGGGVDE